MREHEGVRVGQRVRDLDGTRLGRVVRLYEQGFFVRRGLPILFRRDHVIRWDELREVRGDVVVVARSRGALLELAAGELPGSWRIPAAPGRPGAATPAEARQFVAPRGERSGPGERG